MRIITYEDRQFDTVGLKLLIASLKRHVSNLPLDVIFPAAPEAFAHWAAAYPNVNLRSGADLKQIGYNVKPAVLLQALDNRESEILWMDTDIIVAKDFSADISKVPHEALIVTEEWFGAPHQGGHGRSQAWGFEVGRDLSATTNTCVVRVTPHHRELLEAWIACLADKSYLEAQSRHWSERPIHLQSDQEILSALLESKRFSHIPVHFLRRGRDVAHCFQHQGYIAHQMVANLVGRNTPYFVHGQGAKPWRDDETFRYYLDVSAYTLSAMEYADILDEDTRWLVPRTRSSKLARKIFRDDPWTTGLPLALLEEAKNQRVIKTFVKQLVKRS